MATKQRNCQRHGHVGFKVQEWEQEHGKACGCGALHSAYSPETGPGQNGKDPPAIQNQLSGDAIKVILWPLLSVWHHRLYVMPR